MARLAGGVASENSSIQYWHPNVFSNDPRDFYFFSLHLSMTIRNMYQK